MAAPNSSQPSLCDPFWARPLAGLYGAVFVGGAAGGLCILFELAKMNSLSVTTAAVINLVLVHGLFLLTVPFRLVYLVRHEWYFGLPFCKVASAMLHLHMYLTFVLYAGILLARYLVFFRFRDKVEFYRKLHAVAASAALWALVLLAVVPPLLTQYGNLGDYDRSRCFEFQGELRAVWVRAINYAAAVAVIAVALGLLAVQGVALAATGRKLPRARLAHQEFWAQLKNLVFVGVIFVCFLPYQCFRLYYLGVPAASDPCGPAALYNEIFLGVTALSCLDLLLFFLWGSRWFKNKVLELLSCRSC
ncbi:probable G-protein coupled receptor 141 [Antechinus flavipes]|uniref:probable G-protein coupled receptor 141 n=1 Tax=Antechinus flavipes TaxID=38775 RepID=UPI0022368B5C|nr:probable G-protein coupled receptor 141 [Antechinus flavipes]